MGFADEVIDPIEVVAISKVWNFKNAPQNLIEQDQPAEPEAKEVPNQEPDKEEPVIEQPKAGEVNHAEPDKVDAVEVAEICMIAKVPHMTAEFLKSGLTIGEIKNKIISVQAERNNQLEIETVKNLGSNLQAQSLVSKTAEIYARLNQKK